MTPREDHHTSTVEGAAAFEQDRAEEYDLWDLDRPSKAEARADMADDERRSRR